MLNLPRKTLDKVRQNLLRKQKEVEEEIKELDEDDPVLSANYPSASEPASDAWRQETHTKLSTLKGDLLALLGKIKEALSNVKSGQYGKCSRCGKAIDPKRLEAVPTADLCFACSQKESKK